MEHSWTASDSRTFAGLTGLGAEVAKNVILAGVAQVTLMDLKKVSKEDFRSQFMVSIEETSPVEKSWFEISASFGCIVPSQPN